MSELVLKPGDIVQGPYSFSGGVERGATLGEIKRHATTLNNPSSVIAETLELLKERLFYLQSLDGKFSFSNQPNLNRIILMREENISESEIGRLEREWLQRKLQGKWFKTYIWPRSENDIPDTLELKLILFREQNEDRMQGFLERKGNTPRVHRNTLFFLTPMEYERGALERLLRRYTALRSIEGDSSLNLTAEQRNQVKKQLKQLEDDLSQQIRRCYRLVHIPSSGGKLASMDMGIPTYGVDQPLDKEVYDKLRTEGEILENLQPLVLKEKYLGDGDYVRTAQLVRSWSQTAGAPRVVSEEAWKRSIAEGVRQGLFGLGVLKDREARCQAYKESPIVNLSEDEVIIRSDICETQHAQKPRPQPTIPQHERDVRDRKHPYVKDTTPSTDGISARPSLGLRFTVPKGKVSGLLGVFNLIQHHFDVLEIELKATKGGIGEQEYEKIQEAFRQMEIEVEEM